MNPTRKQLPIRIRWVAAVAGVAVLLLSGCAGPQVMYRHRDFQFSELRQGGLAIGGVSGMQREPQVRGLTSEVLRDDLSQMLTNVHVTALEEVRRLVGLEQHAKIVAEVSEKLGPEESDLRMISTARELPRFLLWVHLTGHSVWQHVETSEITEWDTTYNKKTKSYETTSRTVGYNHTPAVSVSTRATVVLYDRQRDCFVWVAGGGDSENGPDTLGARLYPPTPGVVVSIRKIVRKLVVHLWRDGGETAGNRD